MNMATVAALPAKVSRHNTQSRAHSITKIVKSLTAGSNETVVLVCSRKDVYASGCAVARAYSLYSRKTAGEPPNAVARPVRAVQIRVEFILVDGDDELARPASFSQADLLALNSSCEAIQLTARLVDTPCNEMN